MITSLKAQLRAIQSEVIKELESLEDGKYDTELSLNAFIGSKTGEYIDLVNEVMKSPLEYKSKWMKGLNTCAELSSQTGSDPRHIKMLRLIKAKGKYSNFKKYLSIFLDRSFLTHYEEHYKAKPKIDESEYWFGNNGDEFGLLVTPRFVSGRWENDKSEIRHFQRPYWTIAHVMESGLCYMNEDKMRTFSNISDLMQFLRDIARRTKSKHQITIMDKYLDYVNSQTDPMAIPFLIPELRYDPFKSQHEHRLDFLIINPWSLSKFGFELSPWSTHGKLKVAKRSMADYDREAQANFEKEMSKHKKYWRKYGVSYVTYTDNDLLDTDEVWKEIESHLIITENHEQIELALLSDLGQ
jgi:hypothetical protein